MCRLSCLCAFFVQRSLVLGLFVFVCVCVWVSGMSRSQCCCLPSVRIQCEFCITPNHPCFSFERCTLLKTPCLRTYIETHTHTYIHTHTHTHTHTHSHTNMTLAIKPQLSLPCSRTVWCSAVTNFVNTDLLNIFSYCRSKGLNSHSV